jgi:hypothetical protein
VDVLAEQRHPGCEVIAAGERELADRIGRLAIGAVAVVLAAVGGGREQEQAGRADAAAGVAREAATLSRFCVMPDTQRCPATPPALKS